MIKSTLILSLIIMVSCINRKDTVTETIFCTHNVVLDEHEKIIPWFTPRDKAYDNFLRLRWDFIKTKVPYSPGPDPRSRYPQYYFYCAFRVSNDSILPDTWMNDIAEKIPNWFENARLYYAYSGDSSVMKMMKDFIDYTLRTRDQFFGVCLARLPLYNHKCRGYNFQGICKCRQTGTA